MATANSTMAQNQYLSRPTSPKMARKCGEGVENLPIENPHESDWIGGQVAHSSPVLT